MNYLLLHYMPRNFVSLLIAVWLGLFGCAEDQTAGTSSTTGNPVKVGFGFKEDGSTSGFTGRVTLYPLTYMPVFDTVPLSSYSVSGDSIFFIRDSVEAILDRVGDSLRPKEGDTLFGFNIFVNADDGRGAALLGIKYRLGKGFHRPSEWAPSDGKIELGVLSDYQGRVDVKPTEFVAHFLYLPGTPHFARLQNDLFILKGLPAGSYDPLLLPVQTTRTAGNSPILGHVQSLGNSIVPWETKIFSPGEIKDTIRVPDDWWMKNFGQ